MNLTRTAATTQRPAWLSTLIGPDGQALGIILLVWLVFFGPLFAPLAGLRASFPPGDFVDQFYAFAVHETREFQAGRLPLWGPYAFAGHPFLADVQSAIFYPVSLAFTLVAAFVFGRYPLTWLTLEAALHFLLAGVFTYALGRRLFRHRGAALVAALTFTYGGYLTGYPPLQLAVLETDVWLPLLLLCLDKAITDGVHLEVGERHEKTESSAGRVGLQAVSRPSGLVSQTRSLGLDTPPATRPALASESQGLRWAVGAGLVWGVAILAGHPQSAMYLSYVVVAFGLVRLVQRRPDRGRTLALALVPLVAVGLSAAQWLPSLEYTRLSVRASVTYQELAGGFPYRDLVQFIVPAIVSLWSPLYVGLLPLVLAGVALARRPDRLVWFWAALGGLALLLSLGDGTPLYRLFYTVVPGFDLFRSQERAAYLVSFALAMLAGYGFLALARGQPGRTGRWVLDAGTLALAVVAAGLGVAGGDGAWVSRLAVAALLTGLIAVWWWRSARWPAEWRLGAAVLLIAGDLFVADARTNLVPPFDLSQAYPSAIVQPMVEDDGFFRARNEWRLPGNYGFLYQIEETWGASPLRLRAYDELWNALPEERRWGMLGVKYVITWHGESPDQATTVLASVPKGEETTYLHRVDAPAPLAWLVRETEVIPDAETRLTTLADPAFDPRRTAILNEPLGISLPGEAAGSDIARVVARAPGRVSVDVDAAAGGLLVLAEIDYPGWRATVDGAPAAIVRADHALMAVPVPAGRHRVELYFDSATAKLGLAASGLTVLAAGALLAVDRRRASDGQADD